VGWTIDWMMRQKVNVRAPTAEAAASRDRIQGGKPAIDRGGTNLFATGKIGIHWRSVNDWRRMWPIIGTAFEWDMLPVPRIRNRPGCSWTAGHPVCAHSKTKHPEAAWAFMRWLIQDEFQGFLAENQYLVPAKKSHQARFFRVPQPLPYQHPQVFADVYKRPYGVIWSHYNAGLNDQVYGQEMGKIVQGETPIQGGLKELERRLNQDVDYGGGENPFKGVRWPIQPK
jgi:ABC-type glycerol-3-phosphate transport system substrate-binding protein